MDCTGTRKDCFYIRLLISEENIMQENDIEFADCIYFNKKDELKTANRIKTSTLIVRKEITCVKKKNN